MLDDLSWWHRQQARLQGNDHGAGYGLLEWAEKVKEAKMSEDRIFIVM